MSSCQGELPETKFKVSAVDRSGRILIDESVSTLKNGFMELWLPRDRSISLTIQGLGRSVSGNIQTYNDSPTCITTFKLQ